MDDVEKVGTDWQQDELDAIVTDYFEMLSAILRQQEDDPGRRHH